MSTILIYILGISMAEAVGSYVSAPAGAAAHAAMIVVSLAHIGLRPKAPSARVLPALMLAPLIRVLSLVMASPEVPQIYWHALVGVSVLVSAGLAARQLGLPASALGLRVRHWALQGLIGLSGLSFGLVGFAILGPRAPVEGANWPSIVASVLVLAGLTALVEEFVFRGLVLAAARQAFGGPAAVLCSSMLFASMYLGSLSPAYFVIVSLVGFYFGYCVLKTGSLAGVVVAHVLMNGGLLILWPAILT